VLLRAWVRAKVAGRLMLVGGVEPDVAERCAEQLRDPTVVVREYTRDLAAVYGDADVFVLPSFEEGSPLVSYLALGAGLPSLLSPAASGWVVRDGVEGIVVEPDDVDQLADGLRRYAEDVALRERLGAAARARAGDYTWDKAAARRLAGLEQALANAR
jgi:glycosyltransferase involved in cell wall biosynthesis